MNKMNEVFENLIVLDMANNHQGSIEHGKRIIQEHGEVVKKHQVKAALKFQFRQLDTFIHEAHKNDMEHKYINRFQSTRMDPADFKVLFDEVKANGMLTMCTPFDEESVDIIDKMGFDFIKIASCSAKDWPLLEKIATKNLPVVVSTGGLDINDIDNLVSFFNHKGTDFAIMHCISVYPTPSEMCQLNQINSLKTRYPDVVIGWSTHEDPTDTDPVIAAYALGARMFERHVGVETNEIKLNAYSSTPEIADRWLTSLSKAVALCGSKVRPATDPSERAALDSLQRGVYLKNDVELGSVLTRDDVYFAIPFKEGQMASGNWKEGIVVNGDLRANEGLYLEAIKMPENGKAQIIQKALHEFKAMLNEARIPLDSNFKVEYSHHYGIENFRETGAVLIDIINRDYCKKLIMQLPGQRHPLHFHKLKEETFNVLQGILEVEVDGHSRTLHPGEQLLVQPGVWHSFKSETGVIFEEISTTHFNNDSFYKDKTINQMERNERKTVVDHWGRFQLTFKERLQNQC